MVTEAKQDYTDNNKGKKKKSPSQLKKKKQSQLKRREKQKLKKKMLQLSSNPSSSSSLSASPIHSSASSLSFSPSVDLPLNSSSSNLSSSASTPSPSSSKKAVQITRTKEEFKNFVENIPLENKNTQEDLAEAEMNYLLYRNHKLPEKEKLEALQKAVDGYEEVARKLGSTYAINRLARLSHLGAYQLVDSTAESLAIRLYRITAARGDKFAQNELAFILQKNRKKGEGKESVDDQREIDKETFELFQAATKQDFCHAQCNLGWCYEEGIGVPKDPYAAAFLYIDALIKGYEPQPVTLERLNNLFQKSVKNGEKDLTLFIIALVDSVRRAPGVRSPFENLLYEWQHVTLPKSEQKNSLKGGSDLSSEMHLFISTLRKFNPPAFETRPILKKALERVGPLYDERFRQIIKADFVALLLKAREAYEKCEAKQASLSTSSSSASSSSSAFFNGGSSSTDQSSHGGPGEKCDESPTKRF